MAGDAFAPARDLIAAALASRAFPACVVDAGREAGAVWQHAAGALSYDPASPPARLDTWFDLASLTKVIATVPLGMRHHEAGRLPLDAPIARWLEGWNTGQRAAVRVRHLLDHSSGLPAHAPLWRAARGRAEFERAITAMPLEYEPGTKSIYSDLGFILLGFILEDAGGAPLDRQFASLGRALGEIAYTPECALLPRIAPTEVHPDRGLVRGDVHDENAFALGGVAAHAGLFGTAAAVAAYARLVLRTFRERTMLGTPETMQLFARKTGVPGSSRALGWDTMLPTSSCGTRMSPTAIGHTGFTGTSLWIDWERDVYVVVLTNRVHPTRENELLRDLRPRLHDAIMDNVGAGHAPPV